MFKFLVVLSASLCVAYAAISLGPLAPKPEKFKNVEGCYINDLDEVIPFGASKASKSSCMEYRCGSDYVQYITCGAVFVQPPCKNVPDIKKPYPDCCTNIVCS